ncbi:MAG: hypothetical protein U0R77_05215 [Mycolicibacterium insubricum]
MVTKAQVLGANVDAEIALANAWKTSAEAMSSNAETYVRFVTMPGGQDWSGLTRDAMVAMVGNDRTAIDNAKTAIDTMTDTATASLDGAVRVNLKAAVDEIHAAGDGLDSSGKAWGFDVDDGLNVTDPKALSTSMLADNERQSALEGFQTSVPRLAKVWWDSSQAVADQVNRDKAGLATKFNAMAALSADTGSSDGRSALDGHLDDDELARLRASVTLTPEQVAALARGEKVEIGADRLGYLRGLAHAMDGMTPQQIQAMMDKLGADGGRVADVLQLVSNEHVGALGEQGGFDRLPTGMQKALTDSPLEVTSAGLTNYARAKDGLLELGAIVSAGNPALQQGTALDRALLKQVEAGVRDCPRVPTTPLINPQAQVDPALQSMLSAAGRDGIAVHDALAGADGHTPNKSFIRDLAMHQWADGGEALGKVLPAAAVSNPVDIGDPTKLIEATRAGETMHAVDQILGVSGKDFLNIPGMDGKSLGQLNPEFVRGLAEANKPFIDDMVGAQLDNSRGFSPLGDPMNAARPEMRNLFAVIDSDADAANILNTQAYADQLELQGRFTHSVIAGDMPDTGALGAAGALKGVVESGANAAANDDISDANAAAKKAFDDRKVWFDGAKNIAGELPGVKEVVSAFNKLPSSLQDSMSVGTAPTPDDPNPPSVVSTEPIKYALAAQFYDAGLGDTHLMEPFIDPGTGQFKPYIPGGTSDLNSYLNSYLNSVNGLISTGVTDWDEMYTKALPHAASQATNPPPK